MPYQRVVRALYAYEATDMDELSFGEDELLVILPDEGDEQWLLARALQNGDNCGLVPANYVEALESLAKLRGLYEYSALEDNELSFGEGEILTLVAKLDDDWWLARNQTDFGLVPANYVEVDTEQLDEGNVFSQPIDTIEEKSLFEQNNSDKVGNLLKECYPKAKQEKKWAAEWNDEQRIKGKLLLLDTNQLVFIHGKEKVVIKG